MLCGYLTNTLFILHVRTDFNECSSSAYNNCTGGQQCINTVGSYNCTCISGYRFDTSSRLCVGKATILIFLGLQK